MLLNDHRTMKKSTKTTIEVQGLTISVQNRSNQDFISLTDIARYRNSQEPFAIINNWMRSRSTIEFLGLWEKLSNPDFKPLELERFRNEGNIRDHAPLEQLVVLTNLESLNSVLIRQGLPQPERLLKLNEIAITQMRTLLSANNIKRLK